MSLPDRVPAAVRRVAVRGEGERQDGDHFAYCINFKPRFFSGTATADDQKIGRVLWSGAMHGAQRNVQSGATALGDVMGKVNNWALVEYICLFQYIATSPPRHAALRFSPRRMAAKQKVTTSTLERAYGL